MSENITCKKLVIFLTQKVSNIFNPKISNIFNVSKFASTLL
uniref:Uncharacterized protein n=1 Tax=Arundo donax TaxID=35708 RepID=A0A0A8YKZ3_ARUDO